RVKAGKFSEFRHYNNLDKCLNRLSSLLTDFDFTTMHTKLSELDLFDKNRTITVSY
ncbi:MAG: DUF3473 domain-containing protein, partial [Gammaproteobacteria bacterium]|nr:DUF3473 domain-containing protein [Gammaproteobacteria bacterium]